MPPDRPIVTLTTDFGLRDAYVATMKAAILKHCGYARLIDVTHQVPRHDVLCGSITLERAVDGFPAGSVHLVVVDPGVGTDRRLIVTRLHAQFIICPDNGLVTWPWRVHQEGEAFELTWRPSSGKLSSTFHGRDIMAPVAGMLATGAALETLARPIDDPVLLDISPATDDRGTIIHVDHFGNLTTNVPQRLLADRTTLSVRAKHHQIGAVRKTYWDVEPGKALALIGSSGLLEIAVRDGSAEKELGLLVGDEVTLR